MKQKFKRKLSGNMKKYLLVAVLAILVISISLSLAFFSANIIGEGSTSATVSTEKVANLEFTKNGDLAINATMSNFKENGSNLSDTVEPYVTMTTESAYSDSYYIYFNISENDFVYTQDSNTPELILEITNPDGTKVTEIDGLDYVTSGDVSGFDITTANGSFEVANNYTITSIDEELIVTQDWVFTLYFINLDANQNENTGKTFTSEIVMQKDAVEPVLLSNQILMNEGSGYSTLENAVEYIESKETPDFSEVAITDEGIFATEDNDGTSYYFRGATEDNYVEFADMLWRIIRIDGAGNIKLMYYNDTQEESGTWVGTDYNYAFKSLFDYNYESVNYSEVEIKNEVDSWLATNIDNEYMDYLSLGSYCIDLEVTYTYGSLDYYASSQRLYSSEPSVYCNDMNDDVFLYEYYAGIISIDEVSLAGGVAETDNEDYFLYTGFDYWSISPWKDSIVFAIGYDGNLSYDLLGSYIGAMPTVSLSSLSKCSEGNGTIESPYKIVME